MAADIRLSGPGVRAEVLSAGSEFLQGDGPVGGDFLVCRGECDLAGADRGVQLRLDGVLLVVDVRVGSVAGVGFFDPQVAGVVGFAVQFEADEVLSRVAAVMSGI
jgi:hypothetical protein